MYSIPLRFIVVIGMITKVATEHVKITTCPYNKPIILKPNDVLRLNISYSCPSDGCGKSFSVNWLRYGPETVRYWEKLIYWDGSSATLTKNDQRAMLVNQTNLVLYNVTYRDEGYYKVKLNTKHAEDLFPEHIFHVVLEGVPQIILRMVHTTLEVDQYFWAICQSRGYPPSKAAFYHNGRLLLDSSHGYYTKRDIKIEDAGNYTCAATNSFGTTSKTKFLEVTAGMRDIHFTNEPILYLGGKGEVICKGSGRSKMFYTIFHNGTKVVDRHVDGVYSIAEVKNSDAGNYTCVCTNLLEQLSTEKFYNVKVSTLLVWRHTPSTVYVQVGEVMIIDVSYELPNRWSGAKVWWYHNGEELIWAKTGYYVSTQQIGETEGRSKSYRASIKNRVDLVLSNVTTADNGTYKVVVGSHHNAETNWQLFNVIVHEPIEMKLKCDRDVVVEEMQSFSCECIASQGYPTPTVAWEKGGVPITKATGSSKATLTLKDIRSEQAGTYTCVGISGKLTQKKDVVISVKCPRFSAVFQNNHYAILGWRYFKIYCRSYSSNCGTIIGHTIKRDGKVMASDVDDAVYIIDRVENSDAGVYTCVVQRFGETATTHFYLQVVDIEAPLNNSSKRFSQERKQNNTDELSLKNCNQRWRKEWYIIFITIIFAMFIGIVCGFLVKKFVLGSAEDKDVTPIYRKPSSSDQSEK